MARNDGIDRTVVRNRDLKTNATLQNAQGHNERQKEVYSNPDIVPERSPMNVSFKSPTGSYSEMFADLENQKIISTWGCKPDSTKFCELIFDVNSAYFFNHGGYQFAKQFYTDAYQAAIKIIGGEQYILSAVMHADERNKAMSEALGQDVYHYHLHVVYIPVVEKKIFWTKRCKDSALVGTVKETIMQVSRSKKWESKPVLDENGEPQRNTKGKMILKPSYSVLQDDYFSHMIAAGYSDLQRGERGSTEEHLTVTQFKVDKEQQRLQTLQAESKETEMRILDMEEEKIVVENELQDVSLQVCQAQSRLNDLTPRVKNAEEFVKAHLGKPQELLPEASALERGAHYREEKALPVLQKLWKLVMSLYQKVQSLQRDYYSLQNRFNSVSQDREYYRQRWESARDENDELKAELQDYDRVKQEIGPDRVQRMLTLFRTKETEERERKETEKQIQRAAKRAATSKSGRDAR